jgi:hypothetical protein
MGSAISRIQSVDMYGISDFERIHTNIRALIMSVEGTIPGSRGFGISPDIVDLNPMDARNMLHMSFDEKVEEYIPEIMIEDLDIKKDEDSENYNLTLFIRPNEEYEEEVDEDDF